MFRALSLRRSKKDILIDSSYKNTFYTLLSDVWWMVYYEWCCLLNNRLWLVFIKYMVLPHWTSLTVLSGCDLTGRQYCTIMVIAANTINWFFCSNTSSTGCKDPSLNSDNTDYDIAGLMYVAAASTLCSTPLYSACLSAWHFCMTAWQLWDCDTYLNFTDFWQFLKDFGIGNACRNYLNIFEHILKILYFCLYIPFCFALFFFSDVLSLLTWKHALLASYNWTLLFFVILWIQIIKTNIF